MESGLKGGIDETRNLSMENDRQAQYEDQWTASNRYKAPSVAIGSCFSSYSLRRGRLSNIRSYTPHTIYPIIGRYRRVVVYWHRTVSDIKIHKQSLMPAVNQSASMKDDHPTPAPFILPVNLPDVISDWTGVGYDSKHRGRESFIRAVFDFAVRSDTGTTNICGVQFGVGILVWVSWM